jgi:hypothetical protein
MKFIKWLFAVSPPPDLSGVETLDRARQYLERYGEGKNQEYTRARAILIQARKRVLTELY